MKTNGNQGLRDSVISLLSMLNPADLIRSSSFNTFRSAGKEIQPTGTLILDGNLAARRPEAEILCHDSYRVLQAQSFEKWTRPSLPPETVAHG
jgi:hypothetical protein